MSDVTAKLVRLGSLKLVSDRIEDDIQTVDDKFTEHCENNTHLTPADREKLSESIRVVYSDEMLEFITN